MEKDYYWMQQALQQAHEATIAGEVPIGAVLVRDDQLLASGYNQPIGLCDPTAHAEMVVLRNAAKVLGNYRLLGTTLYVTLEPCAMCAAALIHARVERLVFGAYDARSGAVGSVLNLFDADYWNHRVAYTGGLMADESGNLLKAFFQQRRD